MERRNVIKSETLTFKASNVAIRVWNFLKSSIAKSVRYSSYLVMITFSLRYGKAARFNTPSDR